MPEGAGAVRFNDMVYGPIEKQYTDLDDFVIVRSNGQPLYVLSNAVDDMQDGITHVIRGQDGLANTPKQVLIYEALNFPVPRFAHMSLTLDPQKAKISKRRHGEAVAVHSGGSDTARGSGAVGKSQPLESGLGKGKSAMVHGYGGSHSFPFPYDGGFCGTGAGLFFGPVPHRFPMDSNEAFRQ